MKSIRVRSAYKKYAKELGIKWVKNWNNDQRMLWENIPKEVEAKLRKRSKDRQSYSEKIEYIPKHKYAYVSQEYQDLFLERNKVFSYPKRKCIKRTPGGNNG